MGNQIGVDTTGICLYLAKAFDKVPYQRLLLKLKAHGIDGLVSNWIESWLCLQSDQNMFRKVLNNPDHVLHRLLPPICSTTYKLRPRTHNRVLPDRLTSLTDFNFITRMLFYNTYCFA